MDYINQLFHHQEFGHCKERPINWTQKKLVEKVNEIVKWINEQEKNQKGGK